ncbi:LytR/AlgR family response regulator transcription factor [Emticicia sp. 17c]|uniref:LytR/AlgR family response regulator transcription factor n=1 Tax=Emticicia sp. 17c TaxID=3127704 RepID=UPI00301DA9FF
MTLKCIAVDDESMGRKLLEENIRQIPFLELVRTCKNPFEAMQVLQEEKVDLMFLDIQMPGMLGTKFLQSLREKPMVIFVTAYANYAVESYDLDVVDYLMKPVSLERFTKAAYKALELHQKNTTASNVAGGHPSTEPTAKAEEFPEFFFINVEYSLVKITIKEITHIEGLKDYIKIFLTTQAKPVLTKSTMKAIEEKLPPRHFMRVHKSFIVNLDKIESIRGQRIKIGAHDIPVSESTIDDLLKALNYSK